ncbi:MAG TPA: crosslink repair DNA glycosylase YcaQ family protein [Thermoanaerobaculia bacterium]|nr:crosslink repair DNA glycosylase YcaQ family protein [Thermoanaerobaculia bacterium]
MARQLSSSLPIVPAGSARRLLLDAQGLLADPRRKATPDALYDLIEQMGFVQIDSINIVERAQHLTLAARLQGYRPALLDRLLERERRLFEHWTHDASAIPAAWYPYWKIRFERYRTRVLQHPWWRQRAGHDPEAVVAEVRERIAREGPLMARDFEDTRGEDAERTWWGWKPHKTALEFLWRTGEFVITRRVNFHKVYDLAGRVLPDLHNAPRPDDEAHLAWACRSALARLGVATPSEIAAFWNAVSIEEARAWCERAAASGEIVQVCAEAMDGSKPQNAYAVLDWEHRAAAAPATPPRIRLLSPFDPILRDRRRTLRLFGFDYRFEAFVPAAQRRYGYYVLPILEGERLIGRLDPKVHRDRGVLEIQSLWWEPGVKETRGRRAALEAAVERLARLVGVEKWTLPTGTRP